MNEIIPFWIVVCALAIAFFAASFREALLLTRMHRAHPERGLYWFNVVFLLISTIAVILGGVYLDAGRVSLERLIPPYPGARYAHEQNSVIHGNTWVYVTTENKEAVRTYYQAYAIGSGLTFVADATEQERFAFLLPSGDLFMTLSQLNGKTIIYFSREGSINTVSR